MPFQLLADAVLVLHLGVVLFVVGGLACILVGNVLATWAWVNHRGFRLAHLGAIGFVAVQAWLGESCPLTTLESWLRTQAGGPAYRKGFIEHWVQWLIFYEAPGWVFTALYSAFGALVVLAWWAYPPARSTTGRRGRK